LIVVTHNLELAARFERRFELADGRVEGHVGQV
jgi:predicted ABC-type transport system involved in lysophospholipase L1 biosynthesis ATPase subunit